METDKENTQTIKEWVEKYGNNRMIEKQIEIEEKLINELITNREQSKDISRKKD